MADADRKHVNTSCGDIVKPHISIAKSVYVYVQESQQFWDFVRIPTKVGKG